MSYNIGNFYQYSEELASGAQPSIEQLQELKNNGYEVIFNISPQSARNSMVNEAEVVEKLGMDYVHFPVDCTNLRPIHYKAFEGIMKGISDKKVFVHCGGNIKSSNLIHMYHVLNKGMNESISLQTLYKIQYPENKWFNYFKLMGMKGVE